LQSNKIFFSIEYYFDSIVRLFWNYLFWKMKKKIWIIFIIRE
jgi:hypothetical protein